MAGPEQLSLDLIAHIVGMIIHISIILIARRCMRRGNLVKIL